MKDKKSLGKFYTKTNPFLLEPFRNWFRSIPGVCDETILEPFAGSNNIVKLMGVKNKWKCYDILPTENLCPEFRIELRDTIKNFPKGYNICITNPPYLAKNSATRSKIEYLGDPYDDLYKKCLELMLQNVPYVAAIIPESFLVSGLFTSRLSCVISLTCNMFDDTDCPVCLALFSKDPTPDFSVYRMNEYLGDYNRDLLWYTLPSSSIFSWTINDPWGEIGLLGVDNTKEESIKFVPGDIIDPDKIKPTSRNITRISLRGKQIKNLPLFLEKCNDYLGWYRSNTEDVFLAPFKGLRADGKYRRRLDFETAKSIMEKVLLLFRLELL